jgi:hypothetical protein
MRYLLQPLQVGPLTSRALEAFIAQHVWTNLFKYLGEHIFLSVGNF